MEHRTIIPRAVHTDHNRNLTSPPLGAAHRDPSVDMATVTTHLVELLGPKRAAELAGTTRKPLQHWMRGTEEPTEEEQRVRPMAVYTASKILESRRVTHLWLTEAQTVFGGRSAVDFMTHAADVGKASKVVIEAASAPIK